MTEAATAIVWKGAEALRPYLVPIEDLKDTDGNGFKGELHVAQLAASLERFGQVRPILTDQEDGLTIRAGHHLRLAAAQLGWTHFAALPSEFGSYDEAIAYVLADNRLTEIGTRDAAAQMTLLDLVGEGNLEGTGWTIDDVETLRAMHAQVPTISEAEPWAGGFSETAQQAAERAQSIAAHQQHREVPLLLTMPEWELFEEWCRALQKVYGTTGVKDTILEAFRREVEASSAQEDPAA